ncbi:MAG: PAB-dependent poly(A)-specific ribonuclease subunit 3 [Caeruleum heppii]|nr:MAG: PAB-dependent poly(A)-specific ribonuclease subunit 3 [Caeruleum heppii]
MATSVKQPAADWRASASPKPKGRENAKDTLCKNITIYGHCRYEDRGCAFNHDPMKLQTPQTLADSLKRRLNVDSPTFTPSSLTSNGSGSGVKSTTISPKAANAAPFTPKSSSAGTSTPPLQRQSDLARWAAPEAPEFVPQTFDSFQLGDVSSLATASSTYDTFGNTPDSLAGIGNTNHQAHTASYMQDAGPVSSGMGTAYYPGQGDFTQPLQYHLYAPLGPHRENLLPYQRTVHDFFISDNLREELQRKAEAAQQVLPQSKLPSQIDHFHSLVPLDTTNQKSATTFGYPSWIYKATSSKDGKTYALRRLEGYRLTNEKAIRSVPSWKRVDSGNVVAIHDAFTTGAFGDRSLVFVTDYHPLSKTLTDHHFVTQSRFAGRHATTAISEQVLWGYMVQIASALKMIHGTGLAARVFDPTKILLTSKNRIRLNACAILDVVQYDTQRTLQELQQEDFVQFGRLILCLASNNPMAVHNMPKAMEYLARSYSAELKDCVLWLLSPSQPSNMKRIEQFLQGVSGQLATAFNADLVAEDHLYSELNRELENARLVRLMAKLSFINERPEFQHDPQWSETGDRYFLKLFRDYVFHQVDAAGNPVIDLAHVLTCLNKLDVGTDERISLVSRDEQNCLVVSYKELKRGVESAFQDLVRAGKRN